jgi:hypothetical protein
MHILIWGIIFQIPFLCILWSRLGVPIQYGNIIRYISVISSYFVLKANEIQIYNNLIKIIKYIKLKFHFYRDSDFVTVDIIFDMLNIVSQFHVLFFKRCLYHIYVSWECIMAFKNGIFIYAYFLDLQDFRIDQFLYCYSEFQCRVGKFHSGNGSNWIENCKSRASIF